MSRYLRLALLLALTSLPLDPARAEVQTYWDNDTDGFVPGQRPPTGTIRRARA